LKAPYKLCGLSCHALTSGLQQRVDGGFKILGGGDEWQFRDQPTREAYKHLEEYNFQVMVWEDDVWYMELMLYPPSTDDAYKVVAMSLAGPTTRWQMMRHWNIINPGDHDYGMDDVKGPEQIVIRLRDGLGQDKDYMRRNFQIVHHLITGDEEVDPLINPKKWRAWKMPNRDFTLAILDSRLWRSSQDTAMWDDEGWGHIRELYDRADPTRSLLGEEQFAWLQQLIRTDSSRQICLTGINGMHTVWTGGKRYSNTDDDFAQRDRVAADYAGWVAAGADRVIELLGSRDGVVSVYGDVHNGCIMRNTDHGLVECSFGPIGRSGGRSVIEGFGPTMKDYDGRPLEITALYHRSHADAERNAHAEGEPFYWNFLEMEFNPSKPEPTVGMRVRNMIDAPSEIPRGGGALDIGAAGTGRKPTCRLPEIKTLPHADVRFSTLNGRPIRGARSNAEGTISLVGLIGPEPGEKIMVTAQDGEQADAQLVVTEG
ncbi:MAG: alkaline phosphatase D family protein, partial [Verrucomicrobiota bacterium]